jgi:acyl-CoA reductase-like NAD-dependent aldehyde dehydrogenase
VTISASEATVPVKHTDRFFIGGEWVAPSSDSEISVIDSHSEQVYLTVAEAQAADIDRAVTAAKEAFDHGPWPRLTHAERASYLRALGEEVVRRSADIVQMWPREAGVLALAQAECIMSGQVCASLTRIVVSQPVLSVIPATDEDDAVRIANDTIYGLHGAVFTADIERAREVAGQMRTGAIGQSKSMLLDGPTSRYSDVQL